MSDIFQQFRMREFRMRECANYLSLKTDRIDEQENFYLLSPIQGEAHTHNISVNNLCYFSNPNYQCAVRGQKYSE